MKVIKIAICDDEISFAEKLQELISEYMTDKGIDFNTDIYNSGEKLLDLGIDLLNYNIIFLDINMKGISGIKTAENIRKLSGGIFIVFVSAYMEYSLEGYKYDAIRYILKSDLCLEGAVNECMDSIILRLGRSMEKRSFQFKEGVRNVVLEKLIYIESILHNLIFHINEDTVNTYTMNETLNKIESRLKTGDFIRIHQSFLVNIRYIKNVFRYKAVLTDGTELSISKSKYADVKKEFIKYQGEI